jgi:hypothetical protein
MATRDGDAADGAACATTLLDATSAANAAPMNCWWGLSTLALGYWLLVVYQ